MAKKTKPRRRGSAGARGEKVSSDAGGNGNGGTGAAQVEVTLFTSTAGPLSKHIGLTADGTLVNDSSARLTRGTAERRILTGLDDLAALLKGCTSHNALALGAMRDGTDDKVNVVTVDALKDNPGAIARSRKHFEFRKKTPAYVLLDFDRKGMPAMVAERIEKLGGFWGALCTVCPALRDAAHLIRASTSAGLRRSDSDKVYPDSGGLHGFIIACDGDDSERFLKALHQHCWLHGLGWMMPDRIGKALERSIVDRSVGLPERLVFEGPPVLDPPLVQDAAQRAPVVTAGVLAVDTLTACPPLTDDELNKFNDLKAKDDERVAPDCKAARARRVQELMEERGCDEETATRILNAQHAGTLAPDDVLSFDDPALAGCTVSDVLKDPERFVGRTLADPIEGSAYGRGKAMVMRRAKDGALFINSFAHGGIRYALSKPDEGFTPEQAAEIARLAALNLFQYDLERVAAAGRLGIRVGTLDEVVARHRPPSADDDKQGTALTFAALDPWPEPVVGEELLPAIEAAIRQYVIMTEQQALAVALWIMHAHAHEVAEHLPRLHPQSPIRRCGKTTLLKVIAATVPKPIHTENLSVAVLFRIVEMHLPTLMIDEVDAIFKTDAKGATSNEDMRAMLNAGHEHRGKVYRTVGDDYEPRGFQVGCPTVIAGIGNLPSTLEDRSITIMLQRRLRSEKIERFRKKKTGHLTVLGRKAARWFVDNRDALDGADPALPEELNDRAQDNWRQLIAIADLCSKELGQRARVAAVAIAEKGVADDAAVMALADTAALLEKNQKVNPNIKGLWSEKIVEYFNSLNDRPWKTWARGNPMTQNSLTRLLKPFLGGTVDIRFGKDVKKGYHASVIIDAHARYAASTAAAAEEEPF
jgi:hypothetical protein